MIKQKIKITLFAAVFLMSLVSGFATLNSVAVADTGDSSSPYFGAGPCDQLGDSAEREGCREAIRKCNEQPINNSEKVSCKEGVYNTHGTENENNTEIGPSAPSNFDADCKDSIKPEDCGITSYIRLFTNGLSALVGIVIVVMVVIGGIQYSMARDNPQAVAAARQKIINAVLALLLFVFMFAFLQWIIPGGLF